ncbi:MAG: hypothetical protein KGN35_07365 [Betaproteobacteria bacterium]|nr:hypothetical protein [Betaproteobacteria bacterium]
MQDNQATGLYNVQAMTEEIAGVPALRSVTCNDGTAGTIGVSQLIFSEAVVG